MIACRTRTSARVASRSGAVARASSSSPRDEARSIRRRLAPRRASAPDLEHVLLFLRPGGRKLFTTASAGTGALPGHPAASAVRRDSRRAVRATASSTLRESAARSSRAPETEQGPSTAPAEREKSDGSDDVDVACLRPLQPRTLPSPLGEALEARTAIALKWTKTSSLPPPGAMKPPSSSLNHFTVPVAILDLSSASRTCSGRRKPRPVPDHLTSTGEAATAPRGRASSTSLDRRLHENVRLPPVPVTARGRRAPPLPPGRACVDDRGSADARARSRAGATPRGARTCSAWPPNTSQRRRSGSARAGSRPRLPARRAPTCGMRISPQAPSFPTTRTAGIEKRTSVSKSSPLRPKAPSPMTHTTCDPNPAAPTPTAYPGPTPRQPNGPGSSQ